MEEVSTGQLTTCEWQPRGRLQKRGKKAEMASGSKALIGFPAVGNSLPREML